MTLDAAAANAGWTSLLSSSSNRKRIRIIIAIAFFSQWSANGLASFYLNKVLADIGIVNPTTQLLLNGLLSMWSFAWALLASGTAERFGRRALFLTSACFMTLFFTLQTVCFARFTISGSEAAAHGVNVFIFLHFAAFNLAFSPLINKSGRDQEPHIGGDGGDIRCSGRHGENRPDRSCDRCRCRCEDGWRRRCERARPEESERKGLNDMRRAAPLTLDVLYWPPFSHSGARFFPGTQEMFFWVLWIFPFRLLEGRRSGSKAIAPAASLGSGHLTSRISWFKSWLGSQALTSRIKTVCSPTY